MVVVKVTMDAGGHKPLLREQEPRWRGWRRAVTQTADMSKSKRCIHAGFCCNCSCLIMKRGFPLVERKGGGVCNVAWW